MPSVPAKWQARWSRSTHTLYQNNTSKHCFITLVQLSRLTIKADKMEVNKISVLCINSKLQNCYWGTGLLQQLFVKHLSVSLAGWGGGGRYSDRSSSVCLLPPNSQNRLWWTYCKETEGDHSVYQQRRNRNILTWAWDYTSTTHWYELPIIS